MTGVSRARSMARDGQSANCWPAESTPSTTTSASTSGRHKQVTELIDDLAAKFLESYEEGNERSAVADYGHYFLGSIIISDKDGRSSSSTASSG